MDFPYTHKQLLEQYFTAMQACDVQGMMACYHPKAFYDDPIFGPLRGDDIKDMWCMRMQDAKAGLIVSTYDIHTGTPPTTSVRATSVPK